MQLYEQGKVASTSRSPIIFLGPRLKPQTKIAADHAARHLTHSSGIPRESDFPYWSGPDYCFPTRERFGLMIAKPVAAVLRPSAIFNTATWGLRWLAKLSKPSRASPTPTMSEGPRAGPYRAQRYPDLYADGSLWQAFAVGYGALKRDGTRDLVLSLLTLGASRRQPAIPPPSRILPSSPPGSFGFSVPAQTMC